MQHPRLPRLWLEAGTSGEGYTVVFQGNLRQDAHGDSTLYPHSFNAIKKAATRFNPTIQPSTNTIVLAGRTNTSARLVFTATHTRLATSRNTVHFIRRSSLPHLPPAPAPSTARPAAAGCPHRSPSHQWPLARRARPGARPACRTLPASAVRHDSSRRGSGVRASRAWP